MVGRGKGRLKKRGFYCAKKPKEGAVRKARRAAARGACSRLKRAKIVPENVTPVGEKEMRTAIAVMIRRNHDGAPRSEWPDIAANLAKQFQVDYRVVWGVLEKLVDEASPEDRRPGAGRK